MKINSFEEIVAWQRALELTKVLYFHFDSSRDFGFRDQILRASVSIMNNIAEGFERRTDKEFRSFLYVSKGSAGEVRSMIILARELGKINDELFSKSMELVYEISRKISALIKTLGQNKPPY